MHEPVMTTVILVDVVLYSCGLRYGNAVAQLDEFPKT